MPGSHCNWPITQFLTGILSSLTSLAAFDGCLRVNPVLLRSRSVGKKLYVGNLSYNITNASLEALFAPFGQVRSAEVIQDRDTGRSKGFGFVEMGDDNAAEEAIRGLHDTEQDGR